MTERDVFRALEYVGFQTQVIRFESIETATHNVKFPDTIFFSKRGNGTIELKIVSSLNALTPGWEDNQLAKNKTLRAFSPLVFLLMYVEKEKLYLLTNVFKEHYDKAEVGVIVWPSNSPQETVKNLLFKSWR